MARHPRSWWEELVREQADSGLSVTEFCRRKEVQQNTFYRWRRRVTVDPADQEPAFVPLAVVEAAQVEIELPCGAVVRAPAQTDVLRHVFDSLRQSEVRRGD